MSKIGKITISLVLIIPALILAALAKAETTFSDQSSLFFGSFDTGSEFLGGGGIGLLPSVTPVYQIYTYEGTTTQKNVMPISLFESPSISSPKTTVTAPPTAKNLPSNITFITKGMKNVYLPTQTVAYGYQYKNPSKQTIVVKIVRTVKDGKGKVIERSKLDTKLKPQAVFARQIRTILHKTVNPGVFTVQITVYVGNKVVDQKPLLFTVKLLKQSNITFVTKGMKDVHSPGQTVGYGYQYKNPSKQTSVVKIVRTVKNGMGKVIERSELNTKLKPQAVFTRQIKTKLKKDAASGTYAVTIGIYSGSTLLEQKSLNFLVK